MSRATTSSRAIDSQSIRSIVPCITWVTLLPQAPLLWGVPLTTRMVSPTPTTILLVLILVTRMSTLGPPRLIFMTRSSQTSVWTTFLWLRGGSQGEHWNTSNWLHTRGLFYLGVSNPIGNNRSHIMQFLKQVLDTLPHVALLSWMR